MLPRAKKRTQPKKSRPEATRAARPLVPFEAALRLPANDALPHRGGDGPACCPGDFCRKVSGLLDLVQLAHDALAALKAALEAEALPSGGFGHKKAPS